MHVPFWNEEAEKKLVDYCKPCSGDRIEKTWHRINFTFSILGNAIGRDPLLEWNQSAKCIV
jgi:hypothetical protein